MDEWFWFIIVVYSHPLDEISFDTDKSCESERFVDGFIDKLLSLYVSFIVNNRPTNIC